MKHRKNSSMLAGNNVSLKSSKFGHRFALQFCTHVVAVRLLFDFLLYSLVGSIYGNHKVQIIACSLTTIFDLWMNFFYYNIFLLNIKKRPNWFALWPTGNPPTKKLDEKCKISEILIPRCVKSAEHVSNIWNISPFLYVEIFWNIWINRFVDFPLALAVPVKRKSWSKCVFL